MNINRINYLSQFIVPKVTTKQVVVKKEPEYIKVTEVTSKDNNMNRKEEHDAMYYYNLMKNQRRFDEVQISKEHKNR